ncbi:hypothetical protein HYT51_02770, partial [Candidatus Woesearchaeota archaeon]|nr:hypothetical protein [Candidatus Woesearchaeota archaeon]
IIFRSQITEKFGTGTIDILNELNKRGYLSIEASGEISLAPRFFDVFDITGSGDFKEKTKYFEEKNDLFEKGIDVLMEIQKVGNTCIKQLEERGITSPDIEHMYKRDITYLDGVMRYGRRKYKTSQRVEDLPKTEIRRVERAINYLNEQIAKLPGEVRYNFLQGDAHNGNMITRFGTVSVFDFFHAHLGVWLSDVVDFVTYNELFSNLEHPETFYGKALAKRLEFTENPVIFQLRYAKALEFMTIKRALRAGGALSWILSGEGAYMEEHERMREHLEQRREAYATFLREKLEENSRLKVLADYINP